MSKTRKSPKIAKIMVFRYFFKQSWIVLAMMCVKVCLHMFLLQINQINKIKHSESVSWKQKTRFVCNFHWKSVFRWTHRSITQRRVITLGPFFFNGLKLSARLEEKKSWSFSAKKITTGWDITKNVEGGGADSAPGSFRVKWQSICPPSHSVNTGIKKKDPIPLFLACITKFILLHYFCAKFKSCFDYKFIEGQIYVFINW